MSRDEDFLSRWSRRKRDARRAPQEAEQPKTAPAPATPPAPQPPEPTAQVAGEPAPLPPVESLTSESDFTGFMKPEVDPLLRRQALKTLFSDPRFNVMDGLDVYIDDYSKADPLPEGWLEKMTQVARLGAYEPPREEPEPESAPAPSETAGTPAAPAAATPEEEPPAAENEIPPSGTPDRS